MTQTFKQIGPYEVLRQVASGGMAVVYLARQPELDRLVALKELAAFPADHPALAERFVRESRTAGALSHPNIVSIYDFFRSGDIPYIAMEYMERGSLRPYVHDLTVRQVAGVLEGILAALDHAEAQGVVHRDLKPENVLVTADGGVKLTDFGISKVLRSVTGREFHTVTGTTIGTPAYMSPEQAMGDPVGPPSDIYSVGVLAYEMLVGDLPFGSTAETPVRLLLRHVQDPIPSPRTVRPDLDERVAEWIERLLAKSPDDRPQRAKDAWRELESIVVDIHGPFWRRDAQLIEPETEEGRSRAGGEHDDSASQTGSMQPDGESEGGGVGATPTGSSPDNGDRPDRPRRTGRRRRAAAVLGTGLAALIAGAGLSLNGLSSGPNLDMAGVRAKIHEELSLQQQVNRVQCPERAPQKSGYAFTCRATLAPGDQMYDATVTQTDDRGHYRLDYSPR